MKKKYWRIGIRYVEMDLFDAGFPYVYGNGVTEWGYLDYAKDIKTGDIIVAGGIEKVRCIGEAVGKPVYIFPAEACAKLFILAVKKGMDLKI